MNIHDAMRIAAGIKLMEVGLCENVAREILKAYQSGHAAAMKEVSKRIDKFEKDMGESWHDRQPML